MIVLAWVAYIAACWLISWAVSNALTDRPFWQSLALSVGVIGLVDVWKVWG